MTLRLRSFSSIFILLITSFTCLNATEPTIEQMLVHLDSLIADRNSFIAAKEHRIAEIKKEQSKLQTPEEKYWHNRRLYYEYYVFDTDSAMRYINDNLELARLEGNRAWENEWKINKSFILSVMGLLKDADDVISSVDRSELSGPLVAEYYGQLAYLCSHMSQLSEHRNVGDDYDELSHIYQDSAFSNITSDSPNYLSHRGSALYDNPQHSDSVIAQLLTVVENSPCDSRLDAINAYVLSRLYGDRGDNENRMRYLIKSGCIDVMTANRDIASLEELAAILMDQGDIDRAYTYINYSREQALNLPNRVRAASLSRTEASIHRQYLDKIQAASADLRTISIVLMVVLILLIIMIIAVVNRSRRVKKSRRQLTEINATLSEKLSELSQAQKSQEEALSSLKELNQKNKEINLELKEANYVKEECLGAAFALCSTYIDHQEQFRRHVSRLVKSNSWKELREEVVENGAGAEDMKEFFKIFDTLFLNIYPDFVKDFNELLREDERIHVKPGELNTELRIYALVRLGINDSVKIASILHCSPQTVYNYRLRTRNKAAGPRENFAETVKSLGKYHHIP